MVKERVERDTQKMKTIKVIDKPNSSILGELDKIKIGKRMYRPKPKKLKLED